MYNNVSHLCDLATHTATVTVHVLIPMITIKDVLYQFGVQKKSHLRYKQAA